MLNSNYYILMKFGRMTNTLWRESVNKKKKKNDKERCNLSI